MHTVSKSGRLVLKHAQREQDGENFTVSRLTECTACRSRWKTKKFSQSGSHRLPFMTTEGHICHNTWHTWSVRHPVFQLSSPTRCGAQHSVSARGQPYRAISDFSPQNFNHGMELDAMWFAGHPLILILAPTDVVHVNLVLLDVDVLNDSLPVTTACTGISTHRDEPPVGAQRSLARLESAARAQK
jgi:hypothetical protein